MNKTIQSVLWIGLAEILFNLSSYVVHFGTGRILGPDAYGRLSVVTTLTVMVIVLIGRGVPSAMTKLVSGYETADGDMVRKVKKDAAFLQICIILVVTAIFFFLAPLLAHFLNDPSLTYLFRLSSLTIPAFAAAAFHVAFFAGLQRFGIQAVLKIVRAVSRTVIIVGFSVLWNVEGAVIGYIIVPLVVFFVAVLYNLFVVEKTLAPSATPHATTPSFIKELLTFAWPMTLFFVFY